MHNQTRFYIYDVAAARDQALEGYQSQPCRTAGSQEDPSDRPRRRIDLIDFAFGVGNRRGDGYVDFPFVQSQTGCSMPAVALGLPAKPSYLI